METLKLGRAIAADGKSVVFLLCSIKIRLARVNSFRSRLLNVEWKMLNKNKF